MTEETIRVLKFILVGIWNTVFDLTLFWIFINAGSKIKLHKKLSENLATLGHVSSFLITNSFSYILNSNFTFQGVKQNRGWLPYLIVSVFSLGVSSLLIYIFTKSYFYEKFEKLIVRFTILKRFKISTKSYAFLVKLGTVVVTMVTNYIGYKLLVF